MREVLFLFSSQHKHTLALTTAQRSIYFHANMGFILLMQTCAKDGRQIWGGEVTDVYTDKLVKLSCVRNRTAARICTRPRASILFPSNKQGPIMCLIHWSLHLSYQNCVSFVFCDSNPKRTLLSLSILRDNGAKHNCCLFLCVHRLCSCLISDVSSFLSFVYCSNTFPVYQFIVTRQKKNCLELWETSVWKCWRFNQTKCLTSALLPDLSASSSSPFSLPFPNSPLFAISHGVFHSPPNLTLTHSGTGNLSIWPEGGKEPQKEATMQPV